MAGFGGRCRSAGWAGGDGTCAGCVDSCGANMFGRGWWVVIAAFVVGGWSALGGGMRDGCGREAAEW